MAAKQTNKYINSGPTCRENQQNSIESMLKSGKAPYNICKDTGCSWSFVRAVEFAMNTGEPIPQTKPQVFGDYKRMDELAEEKVLAEHIPNKPTRANRNICCEATIDKIVDLVYEQPGVMLIELCKQLNFGKTNSHNSRYDTLDNTLQYLCNCGVLERDGEGRYDDPFKYRIAEAFSDEESFDRSWALVDAQKLDKQPETKK